MGTKTLSREEANKFYIKLNRLADKVKSISPPRWVWFRYKCPDCGGRVTKHDVTPYVLDPISYNHLNLFTYYKCGKCDYERAERSAWESGFRNDRWDYFKGYSFL